MDVGDVVRGRPLRGGGVIRVIRVISGVITRGQGGNRPWQSEPSKGVGEMIWAYAQGLSPLFPYKGGVFGGDGLVLNPTSNLDNPTYLETNPNGSPRPTSLTLHNPTRARWRRRAPRAGYESVEHLVAFF